MSKNCAPVNVGAEPGSVDFRERKAAAPDVASCSLVRRRWFALAVTGGLMVGVSVLFAWSFRDLTLAQRVEVVVTQLAGPMMNLGELWGHPRFPWSLAVPVGGVLGIISHPILPRWWTFCCTLGGGFLWWAWGWSGIVAGI